MNHQASHLIQWTTLNQRQNKHCCFSHIQIVKSLFLETNILSFENQTNPHGNTHHQINQIKNLFIHNNEIQILLSCPYLPLISVVGRSWQHINRIRFWLSCLFILSDCFYKPLQREVVCVVWPSGWEIIPKKDCCWWHWPTFRQPEWKSSSESYYNVWKWSIFYLLLVNLQKDCKLRGCYLHSQAVWLSSP